MSMVNFRDTIRDKKGDAARGSRSRTQIRNFELAWFRRSKRIREIQKNLGGSIDALVEAIDTSGSGAAVRKYLYTRVPTEQIREALVERCALHFHRKDGTRTAAEWKREILEDWGGALASNFSSEHTDELEARFSYQSRPHEINEGEFTFGVPIANLELLRKVYEFDKIAYVDQNEKVIQDIPFELFREWWREFPTGFLCAFRNGEPFAVFGMFPVTKDWADRFIVHRANERELRNSTIRKAKSPPRTHWYLSGLSTNLEVKGLSTHLPCILGYSLLEWVRFNKRLVLDESIEIVSEGTTSNGEKLLNHIFHFRLESPEIEAGQKPRFRIETNLKSVLHILVDEKSFVSGCRGIREDASKEL
jgi:hypothetical protein